MRSYLSWVTVSLGIMVLSSMDFPVHAVELVRLTEENWDETAPQGKEVDCILGDFVLRNSNVSLVIAQEAPHRHANLTVRSISGCVIDYTRQEPSNDQLSAYYPGGQIFALANAEVSVEGQPWKSAPGVQAVTGSTIRLRFQGSSTSNPLRYAVTYSLDDDDQVLAVHQQYSNPTEKEFSFTPLDSVRADHSFEFRWTDDGSVFTAEDYWWSQAYGLLVHGFRIRPHADSWQKGRPILSFYPVVAESVQKDSFKLPPGESVDFTTYLMVEANRLDILARVAEMTQQPVGKAELVISDPVGPVRRAKVVVRRESDVVGSGPSQRDGIFRFSALPGTYEIEVDDPTREKKQVSMTIDANQPARAEVHLVAPGYVRAAITDDAGQPIAAKVQFRGRGDTPDPFLGPDSYVFTVYNLIYTEDGTFRRAMAPGEYDVIVSHGPEYDAAFLRLTVQRGEAAWIRAQLPRVVDTTGWISADFHSHSSPSGDNTCSQLGRVLNLLAEHIEFAPCTEHNRISTYVPHLRRLDALDRMATCCGIELTGQPLPINHQNAFPLVMHEHHQDGGGPQTSPDPVQQIERLALWDDQSDKLVQGNHPNLAHIYGDRDGDGRPDEGFRKMIGWMDVVEVHPPHKIFLQHEAMTSENPFGNTMIHWLQLLNKGHRLPGVVNTDAHYAFHGSGWLRNYIACSTDDPSRIDTLEIVHAAEHGHLVMTNGPFLEVVLKSADQTAIPGDDLRSESGACELSIRVQCPNWFEIDRVQVFINGRPRDDLNFVRRQAAEGFQSATVNFERTIPLALSTDGHVIVAAIGEQSRLGPVMGPDHENDLPVAVSNPIYVDADGGGFQANGDLLDSTLP